MKVITKNQGSIALLDALGTKKEWQREEDHREMIGKRAGL